ncbi:NAD-dependent epimerase/dehydratase family protein [Aeromonas hydrophila]|uniref:NAD-dependent epimerase/dehydratase family protein n=1 Tax=Aeromonas hydrophila TaxID=644 RepID=UPI000F542168|nr:NAD-dependent epimerase/dehydratase family protein [Aeromonas hydrophila]RQM66936.1 NAD-dependent epimerase/dehydratase family protein [Aeromonas hydrophila]WGY33622.1 NAD-dependent epimerase/dehydratase family protein [Aeromonas hydrophila]HDC4325210.1 NAD-dependent epimerase/dehydratase family protein [Aeromonas hydrophila]
MKILLTGATGFIGKHVAIRHSEHRKVVRKFDPHNSKDSIIVDSIDSNVDWGGKIYDIDAVIHLAGIAHSNNISKKEYTEINTNGTLHLATEAARAGIKRFVFVSSIGVNGVSTYESSFTEQSIVSPHNSYTQSKYDAELGLKKIAEDTGLEVVIVRPTLVYGPNAPGNFGLLTKLVQRLPVLPFGLINNKRDFIAVQNLADLLITCVSHPNAAGHIFLASDMKSVSIKQFTNAISEGLGKQVLQLPIPVVLIRLAGKIIGNSAMVEQLVGNLQVDSSNIKEVLDWTPPLTMQQAMATLRD